MEDPEDITEDPGDITEDPEDTTEDIMEVPVVITGPLWVVCITIMAVCGTAHPDAAAA